MKQEKLNYFLLVIRYLLWSEILPEVRDSQPARLRYPATHTQTKKKKKKSDQSPSSFQKYIGTALEVLNDLKRG